MLPISTTMLIESLYGMFNAVCLLDVPKNLLTQLKFPASPHPTLAHQEMPWKESLSGVVHALVHPSYQASVLSFLQPERIRDAFVLPTEQEEIAFLTNTEQWNKVVVKPLVIREGRTEQALYMQMDTTPSRRQVETLMRENLHLREISERDRLTDLFNRTKLLQMIQTEYSEAESVGVLFFDINNLKEVNDTQGHDVGDHLIRLLSESLRSVANRTVHAYRYGGDEFLVIAKNARAETMDTLILMCRNRLHTLTEQSGLRAQVAVGKAWSEAPLSVFDLIHDADEDMYCDKRAMKKE